MTFQQDGTDPQRVDRLRQQVVRRGVVGLTIERLKRLDGRSRQRMCDMLELNAEVEAGQPFGIVFGTGKCPDDVQQFFFGQANERAAQ